MKTLYAIVLLAFVGLAILGCSETTDQLIAPVEKVNTLSLEKGVIHSATGSAHWRLIGTQSRVRFSFNAIQHSDGSFSGQVRNNDEGPTLKFHGEVYDLIVEENRAKICWTMTRGAWIAPDGTVFDLTGMIMCVVVVDNGEGNSESDPDLVSLIWGDPPGTYYPSISMTIEQLNGLGIDEYLDNILILTGMTYNDYVPAIDQGSVQVR